MIPQLVTNHSWFVYVHRWKRSELERYSFKTFQKHLLPKPTTTNRTTTNVFFCFFFCFLSEINVPTVKFLGAKSEKVQQERTEPVLFNWRRLEEDLRKIRTRYQVPTRLFHYRPVALYTLDDSRRAPMHNLYHHNLFRPITHASSTCSCC